VLLIFYLGYNITIINSFIFIMKRKIFFSVITAFALSLSVWTYSNAASTITICVKQNGYAYVVGVGGFQTTDCSSNDSLLTWNIQGPQGDTGPQGVQGPGGPDNRSNGSTGFKRSRRSCWSTRSTRS
jgi:hypothetical protein